MPITDSHKSSSIIKTVSSISSNAGTKANLLSSLTFSLMENIGGFEQSSFSNAAAAELLPSISIWSLSCNESASV